MRFVSPITRPHLGPRDRRIYGYLDAAKKPNGYARLFADWSEADLRAFIRRDRNHPSVILWSTGNEVGEQGAKRFEISWNLTVIAKEEDPTRLSTAGCDRPHAGNIGFHEES